MVELIFGAIVACSNGYTTASAETTWEMGARWTGVVCTVTMGSFSFSVLPQPFARHSSAAMAQKRAVRLRRDFKVVFVVGFMESSKPPSMFADLPGPRDSVQLRLDMRCWLGQRWSVRPRLPGRWLRRPYSEAS